MLLLLSVCLSNQTHEKLFTLSSHLKLQQRHYGRGEWSPEVSADKQTKKEQWSTYANINTWEKEWEIDSINADRNGKRIKNRFTQIGIKLSEKGRKPEYSFSNNSLFQRKLHQISSMPREGEKSMSKLCMSESEGMCEIRSNDCFTKHFLILFLSIFSFSA